MAKGDDFERLIPKQLSVWFSHGEHADLYWRKRTRFRRHSDKYQLGDIVCETAEGRELTQLFNIELKTGYSKSRSGTKTVKNVPWDLLDLVDYIKRKNQKHPKFILAEFWEQTIRDADLTNRIPMLIFKRDYHVPVVSMVDRHIRLLEEYLGANEQTRLELHLSVIGHTVRFYRMDEFFEWLTPEVVCILAPKLKNNEFIVWGE